MRGTVVDGHQSSVDRPVDAPQEPRLTTADSGLATDGWRLTTIRSAALTALAIIAVVLLLQFAQAIVVPVVLGILISYALDPLVTWLAQRHVPRTLAAAIVVAALAGGAGWLAYAIRGQANAIVSQLPETAQRLRALLQSSRPAPAAAIQQVQTAANELAKAADAAAPPAPPPGVTRVQVETPPFNVGSYLVWGSISAATAVAQLVLILFFVYFLLASGDLYRRKLVKIAGPTLTDKKITVQILQDIDRQIATVLLAQAFSSALVAIAMWLALRAFGIHQAAVWGIVAGIFTSIPYFGTVIVTAVAALIAGLQFGTVQMTAIVAATTLVITMFESLLLTPWLTRRAVRMNAVAVFVGLLFWGWLWNVWGLLLAVPLMLVVKTICDRIEDFRPVGELLGD